MVRSVGEQLTNAVERLVGFSECELLRRGRPSRTIPTVGNSPAFLRQLSHTVRRPSGLKRLKILLEL